jgi:hypothetical protein
MNATTLGAIHSRYTDFLELCFFLFQMFYPEIAITGNKRVATYPTQ